MKRRHAGESRVPLAVQVKDEVILHVNVPSATPARIVINDRLSSFVMCGDLDRQVRFVVEFHASAAASAAAQ